MAMDTSAMKQVKNSDNRSVSIKDAAIMLGLKEKSVYSLIYSGALKKGADTASVDAEALEKLVSLRKLRKENYTISDVARILDLNMSTVRNDIWQGRLTFVDGYIPKNELNKYIKWRENNRPPTRRSEKSSAMTARRAAQIAGVSMNTIFYALKKGWIERDDKAEITSESLNRFIQMRKDKEICSGRTREDGDRLTKTEAARLAGVSVSTIRYAIKTGKISYIDGAVVKESLDAYINKRHSKSARGKVAKKTMNELS